MSICALSRIWLAFCAKIFRKFKPVTKLVINMSKENGEMRLSEMISDNSELLVIEIQLSDWGKRN